MRIRMLHAGSVLAPLCAMAWLAGCATSGHHSHDPRIENVRAYRAAMEREDLETARSFVDPDARIWYEKRVGEGTPWQPGTGAWNAWDHEFHSRSKVLGDYQLDHGPWGDAVWVVVEETNDYYRLTERNRSLTMLTWFVDDTGRIAGAMVARVGETESLRDQFITWARENAPDEIAYLMPEGRIDPTGDRPQRHRALLDRWRAAVGLSPIPPSKDP